MAAAFVQFAQSANGSATRTTTAAATLTVTSGHLLVVCASWDSGSTPTVSLADTLGSAWTALPVANDTTDQQSNAMWWTIAGAGGSDTFTVTLSASSDYFEMVALEYSGVSGVDVTAMVANQAATTTPATGSVTTTAAGDLVLSHLGTTAGQSVTGHPSGSTQRCGKTVIYVADQIQASAGAINPTWATASGKFNGFTASFKAATGGGSSTYAAAGASAGVSGAVGAVSAVLLAAGMVAGVTGVTGNPARVTRTYAASGVVAGASTATGTVTADLAATGNTPATSGAAGSITAFLPTSGSTPATSGAAGSVTASLVASGVTAATSSVTGMADIIGGAQTYPANGAAVAVSTSAGTVTVIVGPRIYDAGGTISSSSATAGTVQLVARATGVVNATTAIHGSVTIASNTPARDIDVTASPVSTGWQVMGTTGYPITTGAVNNNNGYNAGTITVEPWTAAPLINYWSAGPVWIQES